MMKTLTSYFFLLFHGYLLAQSPWTMHTIDNTSLGADGAKLADVNGDGLQDIVVGWEQGHIVRLYRHPGIDQVHTEWDFIEVAAPHVEDAVLVDLNSDGFMDIVSCSEGPHQRMRFHWAPTDTSSYWQSEAWTSVDVPCTIGRTKWMFAQAMDVDGKNGIDLIVGSKHPNGTLGWLESPADPSDVDAWQYHEISPAGWIMSIEIVDMDHDGHEDILISDRKGPLRGVKWFQHPELGQDGLRQVWPVHVIGLADKEPLFLDITTFPNAAGHRIWVATQHSGFYGFLSPASPDTGWIQQVFPFPNRAGRTGKSIVMGDVDQDSVLDLVTTYEHAERKSGVMLSQVSSIHWNRHRRISGKAGIKYDFAQLIDLDGDSDLDVLTCEEANNAQHGTGLGVIWYENPTIK